MIITFNRPDKLHALSFEMSQSIGDAIIAVAKEIIMTAWSSAPKKPIVLTWLIKCLMRMNVTR